MQRFDHKIDLGRDQYLLLESGELTSFARQHARTIESKMYGHGSSWFGCSYREFASMIETGDDGLVAESEEFLKQIEDQIPVSRGWRNIDDVVGAVPNVPAFLAGHPQCMRRRERTMRDSAPLAIYMDLTSSGGISARDVQRRGIVLLALTRLLVEHRPVELWVGSALGSHGQSGTTAWRIDTAPLDLARAAFHIGATVMSRGFGYAICQAVLGTGGAWPFNSYSQHCDTARERLRQVFPGQELLFIPPIFVSDELTSDPVGWIKRTMASYVLTEE